VCTGFILRMRLVVVLVVVVVAAVVVVVVVVVHWNLRKRTVCGSVYWIHIDQIRHRLQP
jgi:hypothetical protein